MPRWIRGPFPRLAGLAAIDVNTADELDILERCDLINECLAEAGCNCNGHALGNQRDEYFGADISEIVSRCTPHEVEVNDSEGNLVAGTVHIRIETLQAEVDGNGEVCAWIYQES